MCISNQPLSKCRPFEIVHVYKLLFLLTINVFILYSVKLFRLNFPPPAYMTTENWTRVYICVYMCVYKQPKIDLEIRKRKWGWLGHTLRKPMEDITRQALEWNPHGKRGRGRPKNTWRRTVLEEANGMKKTWAEIKCDAKNRVRWRILVDALCSAAQRWDY